MVTSLFADLARFLLTSTEQVPGHTVVVLPADNNYEYADIETLREAARAAVRDTFGEPTEGG